MSFTETPVAARFRSQVSEVFMFQKGRVGRGLWLPTQVSTRMVWCGVRTR